ncbi:MAG: 4'-phosphopantetheinyl transferase superfamily protein [Thermodesulfobacteriota bacterium]
MKESTSYPKPQTAALDESDIHVWTARPLALGGGDIERLGRTLSPDESGRAAKLRPGRGRDMFVGSRGILRHILSLYTGEEPGSIEFGYGKGESPSSGRAAALPRSFNVSHSHEVAMYAIAAGKEVGIDVEYLREVKRPEDVIRRFFTETEGEFYRSRPEELKREAFFRLWTFREASVKAGGYGVFTRKGLVIPGPPPEGWLLDPGSPVNIGGSWSLVGIDGPRDYVAAVAVQGGALHVRKFDFPPSLP